MNTEGVPIDAKEVQPKIGFCNYTQYMTAIVSYPNTLHPPDIEGIFRHRYLDADKEKEEETK